MSALKKTTRFLLVDYVPPVGYKPHYRRGGMRFFKGQQALVDVDDIGQERAEVILSDGALQCRQLTAKGAEKHHRLLEETNKLQEAPPTEGEVLKLNEALNRARADYKRERARADELERSCTQLLEDLTKAEHDRDELAKQLDELRELFEDEPVNEDDEPIIVNEEEPATE